MKFSLVCVFVVSFAVLSVCAYADKSSSSSEYNPDHMHCRGKPAFSCSDFSSKTDCDNSTIHPGCYWLDVDLRCGGTPTPCEKMYKSDVCEAVPGCTWKPPVDVGFVVAIIVGIIVLGFILFFVGQILWNASHPPAPESLDPVEREYLPDEETEDKEHNDGEEEEEEKKKKQPTETSSLLH